MRTLILSLRRNFVLLVSVFVVAVALFPAMASAQVSNYVDLSGDVSAAAASMATNLPIYIVLGLGIFVGVLLFRVGLRWVAKFVRS